MKEIDRRVIAAQPGGMPQETVDLVGQDELLEIHALLAERIRHRDRLAEIHIAIVVAVNQQHRRAPRTHARHRRRFERRAAASSRAPPAEFAAAMATCTPIVDAVEIHAGGKQARSARQPERRQVAAVRPAPQADPRRVDVGARAQIESRALHVVKLTGAARAIIDRLAEVEPVADAAAIVDGEHDVSLAGQVLIHRVRIVVVVHVVPAQQHLPPRSAVHEDQGGMFRAAAPPGGRKSCA